MLLKNRGIISVFNETTKENVFNKMFQGQLYLYKAVICWSTTFIFVKNGYHKSVVICISKYQTVFYKVQKHMTHIINSFRDDQ